MLIRNCLIVVSVWQKLLCSCQLLFLDEIATLSEEVNLAISKISVNGTAKSAQDNMQDERQAQIPSAVKRILQKICATNVILNAGTNGLQ